MPAEWEPHAATWLAWPHEPSDWPGKFEAVQWVIAEMARHLQDAERIRLIVRNRAERARASRALSSSGVSLKRVDFIVAPTDRSWTRDFLPLGVVRRRGRGRELAAVKWRFNGWARYKNHANDEAAGDRVARRLGVPTFHPEALVGKRHVRVVLEGGAIDVDGQGTLLATEQCLLSGAQARNRSLGRAGTEAVLRDYLGAEKVLWLKGGIAGDDTGGHVDDFARFVAPGRVVLAQEPNRRDPNYRPLRAARKRLAGARDARGRRLEIVPLPMPRPVMFAGERLPASYANFYIGTGAVLVPTFNDPNDRVALGILAELFPKRTVVGIHSTDFVLGLGTIHCSTQQEPLV
ncbi:MAG: agmatine/peptidylarginine deiminase [Gemmatimonadales bacterium]